MIVGDAITTWRPGGAFNLYWPLLDSPVHATLALLVVSPLILRKSIHLTFKAIMVAGLAAVLLDLDHVVAADSFFLYDITHLTARPDTHSLLFAIGCGLLASILNRNVTNGWLIFGALASHVLRDASIGTAPVLWPLSVDHLAIQAYYALQVGLYLLTLAASKRRKTSEQNAKLIEFIN